CARIRPANGTINSANNKNFSSLAEPMIAFPVRDLSPGAKSIREPAAGGPTHARATANCRMPILTGPRLIHCVPAASKNKCGLRRMTL
ncbi:MAG TPA: hypothetical protein VKD22_11440, partial [Ramlibacter sp.]|nr:hypothetical protein [Ramlibacter sp.]